MSQDTIDALYRCKVQLRGMLMDAATASVQSSFSTEQRWDLVVDQLEILIERIALEKVYGLMDRIRP